MSNDREKKNKFNYYPLFATELISIWVSHSDLEFKIERIRPLEIWQFDLSWTSLNIYSGSKYLRTGNVIKLHKN